MNVQLAVALIHMIYQENQSAENQFQKKIPPLDASVKNVSNNAEISEKKNVVNEFLEDLSRRAEDREYRNALASWNYESNITNEHLMNKLAVAKKTAEEHKEDWLRLRKLSWATLEDDNVRRQFQALSKLGLDALSKEQLERFREITSNMTKIYSTATICAYDNPTKCDLRLQPDLENILATSKNPVELKHVWLEWRNAVGPKCKELFEQYVKLSNEASRLNGYKNTAESWLESYENPEITVQIEQLWQQLKPLYLELHAYYRAQLRKKYGDIVSAQGPIPAHLLGNMWSQSWRSISQSILPFPDEQSEDLTAELKRQNYTPRRIFETAENFFTSMNLSAMPPSFWEKSIFEKPKGTRVVCQASAWDFRNGQDFRIKTCTKINLESFISAHHEMGHIEYYLQYKNQPVVFRRGANDGFHEGIGDLVALSVQSRKHLRRMGLLKGPEDSYRHTLNTMFQVASEKIVLQPFAYLMDLWRWGVFKGDITPKNYNCKWWELRVNYQGIKPPNIRSESDFDPAAKFHVVGDVPYLRYFVSHIIQFQLHRSLCKIAGEYEENNPEKPLHNCDIYKSTEAGNVLKKMLEMGSSRPWPDAIEVVTGQRTMDATAVLEYFKPLHQWLSEENRRNGAFVGWSEVKNACAHLK